jgi:hypothetical protein
MGIVEDLLGHPGLYLGIDRVASAYRVGAARIVVTPLPGQAGVAWATRSSILGRPTGHAEHTMIGRTHQDPNVMVISDMHAPSVGILWETEPGAFEAGDQVTPYPMKVVLSMPKADHLHHAWWFGAPGEEPVERVVAELVRAPSPLSDPTPLLGFD